MNNWKHALSQAFDAPAPVRKGAFLRQPALPGLPLHRFLLSQFGYIRKGSWCVSLFVFLAALLTPAFLPRDMLWMISGLTPLLALTIISEGSRSACWGMAELEMATRFSLKAVTLARLTLLGAANLLLLGVLLPIALRQSAASPLAAGVYLAVPFLLTSFATLCIVRRVSRREASYACAGIAVLISFSVFFSHRVAPFLYEERFLVFWAAGAAALCVVNGRLYTIIINQTEELTWNLS